MNSDDQKAQVLNPNAVTAADRECVNHATVWYGCGCRNIADKTQFTLQTNQNFRMLDRKEVKVMPQNYSLCVGNYIFWRSSSQNAHPLVLSK